MRFFFLLPTLALIGAGCATSTSVNTTAETETPAPVSAEFPAPGNEDVPELVVSGKGETTVTTDDGTTFVFEEKTEAEAEVETEDGVPITDVVLGNATLKLDIVSSNFAFVPNVIEAKAGEKIALMFKENTGFHTFVIDQIDLKHAIKAGESVVFTAPKEPGSYPFYCDVGSHRAMGMEGMLIVK